MKTQENQTNYTKLKAMILRIPTKCAEVDRFTGTCGTLKHRAAQAYWANVQASLEIELGQKMIHAVALTYKAPKYSLYRGFQPARQEQNFLWATANFEIVVTSRNTLFYKGRKTEIHSNGRTMYLKKWFSLNKAKREAFIGKPISAVSSLSNAASHKKFLQKKSNRKKNIDKLISSTRALLEQGHTGSIIAKTLGVSLPTVYNIEKRLGIGRFKSR
jgi:hypothetical protein